MPYLGEIRMFAGNFVPHGWLLCDGRMLEYDGPYEKLCERLDDRFGRGMGTTALPDFRGRVPRHDHLTIGENGGDESVALGVGEMPAHSHLLTGTTQRGSVAAPDYAQLAGAVPSGGSRGPYAGDDPTIAMAANTVLETGEGRQHENRQPYLCVNFIISTEGAIAGPEIDIGATGSEPLVGEVRVCAFDYAPRGWATCDGQTLEIAHNRALFQVLHTTYGGDGTKTFALPDFAGRVPLSSGHLPGMMFGYRPGSQGGEASVKLEKEDLPGHTHPVRAIASLGDTGSPANASLARYPKAYQRESVQYRSTLDSGCVRPQGGDQAHNNMMPYLTLLFCIALEGIIPSPVG